jgi:hypothetical protein
MLTMFLKVVFLLSLSLGMRLPIFLPHQGSRFNVWILIIYFERDGGIIHLAKISKSRFHDQN